MRRVIGLLVPRSSLAGTPFPLLCAGTVAVDGLAGNVADIEPRQAKVGQLAVAERVELVVGRQVLAVVGEALAQAGEEFPGCSA